MWKLFFLLFLIGLPQPLGGQTSTPAAAVQSRDYRLGSGDVLQISIFQVEDFNQLVSIADNGRIFLPLIGEVEAAGKTTAEVGTLISRRLAEKDVMHNAQVIVLVEEYRSKPVMVLGRVVRPGEYQMARPMRLLDVIALAGGLEPEKAGSKAVIQRLSSEVLEVDLDQILRDGQTEQNIPIQVGDVIQIPERLVQAFYVIGEVHRPGAFELPSGPVLLVSQALAKAGGPMKTAKPNKGILVRLGDNGERQQLAVDLPAILEGKRQDFEVLPNDVIFVPGSTFKSISYALLGSIPRAVSGVIRDIPY